MKYYRIIFLFALCLTRQLSAQYDPQNGVRPSKPDFIALKNATIVVSPEKTLKNATLLIEKDQIVDVGVLVAIPKGALVIDCKDKVIIPAFIELNSQIGLQELKGESGPRFRPQYESHKKGAFYWNESIHPELTAAEGFSPDEKQNKTLTSMGFGFAMTHYQDGLMRGSAALIALGNNEGRKQLVEGNCGSVHSFDKGVSRQSYPSSQMGAIALLRQALYDAQWNKKNATESNLSLDALNAQLIKPLFFSTKDKWEILRAQKIAEEFNYNYIYFGSGREYEITADLSEIKRPLVLPLNFPKAYDVKDPYIAKEIPLDELKYWELAPSNPYLLSLADIPICLSAAGIEKDKDFWENLHKAMERGLSREQALRALTLTPASFVGLEEKAGSLEKGKLASFTVYSADPFEGKATLLENWILGEQMIIETKNYLDITGKYNLLLDQVQYPIEITCKGGKPSAKMTAIQTSIDPETNQSKKDTLHPKVSIDQKGNNVTFHFILNTDKHKGSVNLHGKYVEKFGVLEGDGTLPNGQWVQWSAIRNEKGKEGEKTEGLKLDSTAYAQKIWSPNKAYGRDTLLTSYAYVIKNTTVWTGEDEGVLRNADVVLVDGKIQYVGTGSHANPPEAIEIDGSMFHLTAGIIDEHSHIAIQKGVNEGGQNNSAEVSIGDVVYPEDINIYRQLAGGVTCSQLLHGSANPIGGQSAIIKLKWGTSPDEMLLDNAPKFIKFALGENVKQSNWGDFQTDRFPQTRMGVEQVYYDAFERALAYKKEKASTPKDKFHIDLEMETLVEILDHQRHITCHSYVQSEINMLMHVADSLGFKINTFTHILEGYKVADKMAEHGAGGSTFADWWAYKYEVRDAIPYNAKLMHDKGVVVAINSDDAEMGRRLNQEAAKCVKYGGMTEQEAWKTVTLNPAKLLHIDDRTGSVKAGKDADIVLWSTHPLSVEAKPLKVFVDGVPYFDSDQDFEARRRNQEERARILSKMQDSNEKGEETKSFTKKKEKHYHCDTIGEEAVETENHH